MNRRPRLEDFTCSQCRAGVGEPCTGLKGSRGHARRNDRLIRALDAWEVQESDRQARP